MNESNKTRREKLGQLLVGMKKLGLLLVGVGAYTFVLMSVFYVLIDAAAKGLLSTNDAVLFATLWATMAQAFVCIAVL